ncbi:MAG: conjugal transfer pilus assembly protein TraU [Legionellaceae bacterium]|nr:conjugal transfer pilus assembly protein TraU [Legionellaceae bacterium]
MSYRCKLIFCILFIYLNNAVAAPCVGHFVNPITDVCWRCLFPLSIGRAGVVGGSLPDTENANSPIGACDSRIGLNIGYWEPMALVDITDTPYCLVNLGGHRIPLGSQSRRGGRQVVGASSAFFHVHWYKYPLIAWLNLITSSGCRQGGDFDIAYLSELDPTWNDSEMSFVLNPEAALFGNEIASSSCAADSISSSLQNKPLDSLFWCAGSQGSHYPLTGHINAPLSPVQSTLLLAERMNYKLHRNPPLITDSNPSSPCHEHRVPILPKSRYRYEMVNQVADGKHCYPSGHTTLDLEFNKIKPHTPDQYGFLVWRKRNCVFL